MYDTFLAEVQSHNDLLLFAEFFQTGKDFHKMKIHLFFFLDQKYDLEEEILIKKKVSELFGLNSQDICLHEDF
jgi:hypothetical protein